MRPAALVVLLLALLAAGCGGGGDDDSAAPPTTTEQTTTDVAPPPPPPPTPMPPPPPGPATEPGRLYAKAELGDLALHKADVPRNMRLTKEESGRRTLEEVGIIVPRQINEMRRYGFAGVYDVIFDAVDEDLRLASRLWLFKTRAGASNFLAKTRRDSQSFLTPFDAPALGEESWAAQGALSGSTVISHGFRVGNLVVVVSLSTQGGTADPGTALAMTQAAFTRTQQG